LISEGCGAWECGRNVQCGREARQWRRCACRFDVLPVVVDEGGGIGACCGSASASGDAVKAVCGSVMFVGEAGRPTARLVLRAVGPFTCRRPRPCKPLKIWRTSMELKSENEVGRTAKTPTTRFVLRSLPSSRPAPRRVGSSLGRSPAPLASDRWNAVRMVKQGHI
jgi:hypothetical protein